MMMGNMYKFRDGSVQLLSLGFMSVKGWKNELYNPAKCKVVTKEHKHNPVPMYEDMRGGMDTSDHVDILGNHGVTVYQITIGGHTQDSNRRCFRHYRRFYKI